LDVQPCGDLSVMIFGGALQSNTENTVSRSPKVEDVFYLILFEDANFLYFIHFLIQKFNHIKSIIHIAHIKNLMRRFNGII